MSRERWWVQRWSARLPHELEKRCAAHPRLVAALGFVLVWAGAAMLFYYRFPNNFQHPNFYAEDAYYAQNIVDYGFLPALFTTFNGYFIWGIYLLHGLGRLITGIFYQGNLIMLPRALSLSSYVFLGFCAALPVALLRRIFPLAVRVWLAAAVTLVALPTMDYGIIGTLANAKFAFVYIAALLLIYRHLLAADSKRIWAVDFGLLICAYTTVSVYVMLPFALLRYLPLFKNGIFNGGRRLMRDRSFMSLAVLCLLLLYQIYVIITHGIPALKGFYDQPYRPSATLEILARTFLFGIIPGFYTHLTNVRAAVLLVLFLGVSVAAAGRRWRVMALFVITTIIASTLVFFSKRSGVSWLFDNYGTGAPDQFFFGQNWLAFVLVAGAVTGIAAKIRKPAYRALILGLPFLLFLQVPYAGSFGANNFMANTRGTIFADAQEACTHSQDKKLTLPSYPQDPFAFTTTRDQLCTPYPAENTQSTAVLGLQSGSSQVVNLPGNSFTQTFVSPRSNLRGILLLFATYGKAAHNNYRFTLFDKSCTTELYVTNLKRLMISDNSYYPITFPVQKKAAGEQYCFAVAATTNYPFPIALRLTAPGEYSKGKTILDGKPIGNDVVFELIYG